MPAPASVAPLFSPHYPLPLNGLLQGSPNIVYFKLLGFR
jgi:hypothetical protein